MSSLRLAEPAFYFVRHVEPYGGPSKVMFAGQEIDVIGLDAELMIYGYKVTTDDPHDAAIMESAEQRGYIFTQSFSVACVEGEPGSHPMSELREITRDEFEAAQARGWEVVDGQT